MSEFFIGVIVGMFLTHGAILWKWRMKEDEIEEGYNQAKEQP